MPKRSNDFQKLVYLVRVNLAVGATVTESKMLTDRYTGSKREVDVCIEAQIIGEPAMLCSECRHHARLADVSWVDAMKAKHERLRAVPSGAVCVDGGVKEGIAILCHLVQAGTSCAINPEKIA